MAIYFEHHRFCRLNGHQHHEWWLFMRTGLLPNEKYRNQTKENFCLLLLGSKRAWLVISRVKILQKPEFWWICRQGTNDRGARIRCIYKQCERRELPEKNLVRCWYAPFELVFLASTRWLPTFWIVFSPEQFTAYCSECPNNYTSPNDPI